MALIIVPFILLAVGAALLSSRSASRPPPPQAPLTDRDPIDDEPDAFELATSDPIAALRKYGVPEDAARLAEQGIDLGALGYRPDS